MTYTYDFQSFSNNISDRWIWQRYLILMSGLMLVDLGFSLSYAKVSGNWTALVTAVPLGMFWLGLVNVSGAYIFLLPVRKLVYQKTTDATRATQRLRMLPMFSAIWIFLIGALHALSTISLGTFMDTERSAGMVGQQKLGFAVAWYTAVYAAQFALYAYFVGIESTANIRKNLLQTAGIVIQSGRHTLVWRMIIGIAVIGLLPVLIILMDVLVFDDVRLLQGLTTEDVLILDAIAIAVAVGFSSIVISRSYTKPLEQLTWGMENVLIEEGKLRVAEMTDDELGRLACRFNIMAAELEEKEAIRKTFYKFVNKQIAEQVVELGRDHPCVAGDVRMATVLFTDIAEFTQFSESIPPAQLIKVLNVYFSVISEAIRDHNGLVVNFIGDSVYGAFSVPSEDPEHAKNAIRAATDIHRRLRDLELKQDLILPTRIGINSGPVVAGIVGNTDRMDYSIYGNVVNVASRLEQLNKRFQTKTLVGAETARLAWDMRGSEASFHALGSHQLRGMRGSFEVYEVTEIDQTQTQAKALCPLTEPTVPHKVSTQHLSSPVDSQLDRPLSTK